MTALTAKDFDAFFGALHQAEGRPLEPFPWQRRLVRRILGEGDDAGWPPVLALPTASGKTTCLDIAVFTLACQADRPPEARTAPRRIFFVVDRRVIVNEAYLRAREMAGALAKAEDGVLREVADRLRSLAGEGAGTPPLAAYELRGGIYRDDAWARTPLQPTIVASTVDQVGSRLLLRGYGNSPRSWPIHAGLAALDALVILDEAHCAQPFGETLEAVDRYRSWAEVPLRAPFATVAMTATPRAGTSEDEVFRLDEEDRGNPVLGRRLTARKPAKLLPHVAGKSGSPRFVKTLCDQAKELAAAGARRIVILVNRVETARRVHQGLETVKGARVLMVGRMRPWDRDRLLERWRDHLKAGTNREPYDGPIFVVATQCLEVGADFDFDALVTECASLDALRQRFGRLNRLGTEERSQAAIAVAGDDLKSGQEDFVYGKALQETWSFLSENTGPDGTIDLGIDGLDLIWDAALAANPDLTEELSPPAPHAPVLLPAHLDLWAQTSPVPAPDPDVSAYLHGTDRGAPEVQVCWRLDLRLPEEGTADFTDLLAEWRNAVAAIPPSAPECMPVPLHTVRRWLDGEDRPDEGLADVEGSTSRPQQEDEARSGPIRRVLRWRGPEESEIAWRGRQLRPGDTVVIPSELRGWEVFGHIPPAADGRLLPDVAEVANLERRRRSVLRLHPSLVERWPLGAGKAAIEELAGWSEATAGVEDLTAALIAALDALADRATELPEITEVVSDLRAGRFDALPHASGRGWVLRARKRRPAPSERDAAPLPESETYTSDDDSASATIDVSLHSHGEGVAALAGRYGRDSGLPEGLVECLRAAGRLHDLGKADPRFQAWLLGGNALAAQLIPELLAKSEGLAEDARERERARRRSGYPRGGRHELVSVRLVESGGPDLLGDVSDPDLVLHLVASHHGHCRPLAPTVEDEDPLEVRVDHGRHTLATSSRTGLERLDSGVAERFWRLVRRYGWWGLAFLEALFRLGDHRRSEVEDMSRRKTEPDSRRATA